MNMLAFKFRILFCCFIYFLSLLAAPTTTDHTSSSVSSSESSTQSSHSIHRPVNATRSHTVHPIPTASGLGNFPTPTPGPPQGLPGEAHRDHHDSGQKPFIIFFEVLGGIIAFIFLVGIMRCLISYRKTPGLDRVTYYIHRHQLQREMEELGRNPLRGNRSSLAEPPPPAYFPRPPSYHGQDETAVPLAAPSPPGSPTTPRHPGAVASSNS